MSLHEPNEAVLIGAYYAGLRGMGDIDPAVAEDLGIATNCDTFEAHVAAAKVVKELAGLVVEDPNAKARRRDHQIYEEMYNLTPAEARPTEQELTSSLEAIQRIRQRDGI